MTNNNHLLNKFVLGGIPPTPRDQPLIEVTVKNDSIGNLIGGAEDIYANTRSVHDEGVLRYWWFYH